MCKILGSIALGRNSVLGSADVWTQPLKRRHGCLSATQVQLLGDFEEVNMNVNTCPCHPLVGLAGAGGDCEGGAGSGAAV